METMTQSKGKEDVFSANIWINWSEGGWKALEVDGRFGCCGAVELGVLAVQEFWLH